MTQPKLARQNKSGDDGPRIYGWPPAPAPPEFEVISVTSGTNELAKPWLIGWAAKVTAEKAINDHDIIHAMMAKDDSAGALAYVKRARYESMHEKGHRGTIVHSALETYVDGRELTTAEVEEMLKEKRVPKRMWRSTHVMIDGVLAYLYDTEPEVYWSETTVFNRTHRYAGTPDLIVKTQIDGELVPAIIDVKTSKAIYDETAMQLTAYARGEFVGKPDGTEHPLIPGNPDDTWGWPPITRGVVVRPKPRGGYETGVFDLNDDVFEMFLSCLTAAYKKGSLAASRLA